MFFSAILSLDSFQRKGLLTPKNYTAVSLLFVCLIQKSITVTKRVSRWYDLKIARKPTVKEPMGTNRTDVRQEVGPTKGHEVVLT
ncbi:hypothetical protein HO173_009210 [Letharia columbiana]|uniref:Uncharacterized protein n=1 Tax=Letharia columbiana TaxID=112416 RepID=A0A8H6FPY3_9LECA|nr:uncharacterized protein HO173_009210 [Letharia columbiana]KAF6232542.1 hypothetical protein HO173_009210 [Letharia columbiana]